MTKPRKESDSEPDPPPDLGGMFAAAGALVALGGLAYSLYSSLSSPPERAAPVARGYPARSGNNNCISPNDAPNLPRNPPAGSGGLPGFSNPYYESEEEEEEVPDALAERVDYIIRHKKKFDTANPSKFSCRVTDVQSVLLQESKWRRVLEGRMWTAVLDALELEDFFSFSDHRDWVSVRHQTPPIHPHNKRLHGKFRCSRCQGKWTSGATWRDHWQKCKRCQKKIYPFYQETLVSSDHKEAAKRAERESHDQERCQMCLKLRRLCMESSSLYQSSSSCWR